MRCMKVVLPEPAMPMQTTVTGGFAASCAVVEEEVEAMADASGVCAVCCC